jgi:dienelactone hydrolase
MTAAAGLVLALVCLAIVAAGLALAVAAWQPRTLPGPVAAVGFTVGGGCFLLAATHWLANLLT